MTPRSLSRPATSVSLLHVERSRARARTCRERRDVGGVGGGVAITRCEISDVGVTGDDAIDACLFMTGNENISENSSHLNNYLLLGRDGVIIISVFVRRSDLADLGEVGPMFIDSGLRGGTFSLLESPSMAVSEVRIRFGFGVGSGV